MSVAKLSLAAFATLALAAPALAHAEEFDLGKQGTTVAAADLGGFIEYIKIDEDNGGSTTVALSIHPSFDYFVAERVSLGGDVLIQTSQTEFEALDDKSKVTTYGIGARAGYLVPIDARLALWLRGGIGYRVNKQNAALSNELEDTWITYDARALFAFDVVPHFFVGAGPGFSYSSIDVKDADAGISATSFGLRVEIGGYW